MDAFDIAGCTRVPVPIPGTPDPVAGLEDSGPQAELIAQLVQGIQAGETGTDDDRIEVRLRQGVREIDRG